VPALNFTLELPAGMKAVDGTVTTEELLLETVSVRPPDGATAPLARVTPICDDAPPATLDGVALTLPNASGTEPPPVEFSNTARPGLAPVIGSAISGLPSRLKSPDTIAPPLILDFGGGTR
jgi:hypothetical protein